VNMYNTSTGVCLSVGGVDDYGFACEGTEEG